MSMLSLVSIGAIFGFFYAWVCSIMRGLDATQPEVAITAMQAMNASVRNPVLFPAFFLAPVILAVTTFIAANQNLMRAAGLFFAGGVLYCVGALLVTALVNIPMNQALAQVTVPEDSDAALEIWQAYSAPWQFWNTLRAIASGGALVLTGLAIFSLKSKAAR